MSVSGRAGFRGGAGGPDAAPEPGEEAVEAEVGAVNVDGMRGATSTACLAQDGIGPALFAEVVNRAHESGITEIKELFAERPGEQLDGRPDDGEHGQAELIIVSGLKDVEIFQGDDQGMVVVEQVGVEEAEVRAIESFIDLFGAAEIEGSEGLARNKEIAGMRVGMEQAEVMHLEVIKVPECLADPVAEILRSVGVRERVERFAVDPVHGQNFFRGKFFVVTGKAESGDGTTGAGDFEATPEFQGIIRFLQQARFDFANEPGHVTFLHAHDLESEWFDEGEVGAKTFRDAGVLDLYGEAMSVFGGEVNLTDRGSVSGLRGEGVEEIKRAATEFAAERPGDKRVREGRGGILGLGEE